jgi:integrase
VTRQACPVVPLPGALAQPPGGGACRACGMPHPGGCRIIARHLDYLRMRGRSARTIATRRSALDRIARSLPVPLLDADHDHLMAWRSGLVSWPSREPLAAASVVNMVSHLHAFYDWCVEDGCAKANPAARIPVPRRPRMLPRPITEADLATVLDAAPPRVRPWIVLAAWCGLRAKEIALLQRKNVRDSQDPPVLLVAADATKGVRERAIPLSGFAVAELRRAGLPRAGYVFGRLDGQSGPNTPSMVSELANEHIRNCGVPATLHALRHRFGSQAYQATHDLRLVQELMGHADPAMTAGYAAFDNASAAAAVEGLAVPGAVTARPAPPPRLRARELPAPAAIPERPPARRGGLPEAVCGTESAYRRHRRRGEDYDPECAALHPYQCPGRPSRPQLAAHAAAAVKAALGQLAAGQPDDTTAAGALAVQLAAVIRFAVDHPGDAAAMLAS